MPQSTPIFRRVLLINKTPTPFLIELADAIAKANKGWELDIWYFGTADHRGAHWYDKAISKHAYYFHVSENLDGCQNISLNELLKQITYDVILYMLPLHPEYAKHVKAALDGQQLPIILWQESPLPRNLFITWLKTFFYRYAASKLNIISVFCIGERAREQWQRILDLPTYLVPYYEDLFSQSVQLLSRTDVSCILRFVFSGQLIHRNNINEILTAIDLLGKQGHKGTFNVAFFGNGPLEPMIKAFQQNSDMGKYVDLKLQRLQAWIERLIPLAEADVLLSPAKYSGWGLTIPESLALGRPVIVGNKVESAKYYMQDGKTGFVIKPSADEIAKAMSFLINNSKLVREMEISCKENALRGDVSTGVLTLTTLIPKALGDCVYGGNL